MTRKRGTSFVSTLLPPACNKSSASNIVLNAAQATSLCEALKEDAKGAIFSALSSIADGLAGIQEGRFSWATVKLYYACLYFASAAICRAGYCVTYVGNSPCVLAATPGAQMVFKKGNSHLVIKDLYALLFPASSVNSQPISSVNAFDWVSGRREDVNYKMRKFMEPDVPVWFRYIASHDMRRTVVAYLEDPALYSHDEDHAMVALPIAMWLEEHSSHSGFPGLCLGDSEKSHLRSRFRDRRGVWPAVVDLLS
jgi:hypothetical protein